MKLSEKQRLFARLVGEFIGWIYANGYEVTLGDAYRDARLHGAFGEKKGYGRMRSCHKVRLAIDLNLFKDDVYLTSTEAHAPLGAKWESMHPFCRWGGRFEDGNHYSFEHEGAM